MKKILFILFAAIIFSSCSKDKEETVYNLKDYENSVWVARYTGNSDANIYNRQFRDTLRFTTVNSEDQLPNISATYNKELVADYSLYKPRRVYESHLVYLSDIKQLRLYVSTIGGGGLQQEILTPNGKDELLSHIMSKTYFRVK